MARRKSKPVEETVEVEEPTLEEQPEETYIVSDPISEPTVAVSKEPNRVLATLLEGRPKSFPVECKEDLQVLLEKGIAADFGSEGWARGHRWRAYIRKG